MSTILPKAARHQARFTGESLLITIPSRKQWLLVPFLAVWLLFWAFAWLQVVSALFKFPLHLIGPALFQFGFMAFWLIFWSAGGVFALTTLLWLLVGVETIEVDPRHFHIRRQILGFGRSKRFKLEFVRDLRISQTATWFDGQTYFNSIWRFEGPLTIDYGAKTYRCGSGVDEAEARQIIKLIQNHFSNYLH